MKRGPDAGGPSPEHPPEGSPRDDTPQVPTMPDPWEMASAHDFAGLIVLADSPDEEQRRGACFVLGYLAEQGGFDLESMRLVFVILGHRRPEVRATAAYVIGECSLHGLLDANVLPALGALAADGDADVRRKALSAMTWLATKGLRDKSTIPRFDRALGDTDPEVRMTAAASIAMVARAGVAEESSLAPLQLAATDGAEVGLSGLGAATWRTTVGKMATIALGEVRKRLEK